MVAPEIQVSEWVQGEPVTIAALKNRVILLHTFQMLCPGCILHALPQTQRFFDFFGPKGVAVIGLHTVFEHHSAMQRDSLIAFLHEFRYTFPVGIDARAKNETMPLTMQAYQCKGTPSAILIDKEGMIRNHYFGQADDMLLSHELTKLMEE